MKLNQKKVGNIHKEALAIRSEVEAEIQRQIGKELNQLSLVEEVHESYKKNDLSELPKSEKEILKDAYQINFDNEGKPTNPEEVALWGGELHRKITYHQLINKRKMIEGVSKSIVYGWHKKLRKLANWKRSDYLAEPTKSQAFRFKDHLIQKEYESSSVKNIIGTLNAFWN